MSRAEATIYRRALQEIRKVSMDKRRTDTRALADAVAGLADAALRRGDEARKNNKEQGQ